MPPVSPLTILSLRAWTWAMSMPMAASAERQPPLLPVLDDLQGVRVLEQRLGRDAAPVEAGAAEGRRALHDRDPEPELRGADRGDVAAGARADDDHVVFVRHYLSFFFIEESGTKDTVAGAAGGSAAGASAVSGSSRDTWDLQTRVVVAQFPVRLGQRLQLPGQPAGRAERDEGNGQPYGQRAST